MSGTCFIPGCTGIASIGYRRPGLLSEIPVGKRGYLWTCPEHEPAAIARRAAALGLAAPRAADPRPPPENPPSQQGSLDL